MLSLNKSYKEGSHPLELYVKGHRIVCTDILWNDKDVIGFLYIHKDMLTNAFLVKRYTHFSSGMRTATWASDSYLKFTPFRIYDKQILGDMLLFSSDKVGEIFPSIGVSGFFLKMNTWLMKVPTPSLQVNRKVSLQGLYQQHALTPLSRLRK